MKLANVVIVGVVVLGIFGVVFVHQTFSSVFHTPQGVDVAVGACATGQPKINNSTSSCYISGTTQTQKKGQVYVKGEWHDQLQGCETESVVHCPSQTALWPDGAVETGSYVSAKSPCGGSYMPCFGATTPSVAVRDKDGNVLFYNTFCMPNLMPLQPIGSPPLYPIQCGQKNVIGGC